MENNPAYPVVGLRRPVHNRRTCPELDGKHACGRSRPSTTGFAVPQRTGNAGVDESRNRFFSNRANSTWAKHKGAALYTAWLAPAKAGDPVCEDMTAPAFKALAALPAFERANAGARLTRTRRARVPRFRSRCARAAYSQNPVGCGSNLRERVPTSIRL